MQRVMIVGQPGSGKSTLARQIGQITGLPVVHIDKIHWMPGWQERDRQAKTDMCEEVHARDQWVFEGGHSATWDERLARCDTFVWIDLPYPLRMWRVLTRSARYFGQSRPDLPADCPEQFSWEFYRWIWDTRHTGRRKPEKYLQAAARADKEAHYLRTTAEVAQFLSDLARRYDTGVPARG
ncbi:AAA family ATPase [Thalassobius sp. Cn5-15]|uniref:AAA family ATPase n=1 Tax=Thalassobius sp. Cn5-15 TaxID=2917763 RepID=UPI001EF32FFE|nr:AAA family ATPase [Thalassobius sp. Cn5-15]MCG7493093.1 AAA family ATPase [Thalassobius sp. Cn5-15]